jgi:hypothetical protein
LQQANESSQEGALKITEDQLITVTREPSEDNTTHDGEIDCIEYRILVERTTRTTRYYTRRRTYITRKENKIITETFQDIFSVPTNSTIIKEFLIKSRLEERSVYVHQTIKTWNTEEESFEEGLEIEESSDTTDCMRKDLSQAHTIIVRRYKKTTKITKRVDTTEEKQVLDMSSTSDETDHPVKVERKSRPRNKALSWKTNQECLEVQVAYLYAAFLSNSFMFDESSKSYQSC